MSAERRTVEIDTLRALSERAVVAAGFSDDEASVIVDVLLYAELRGNNQGLVKIGEGAITRDPLERPQRELSQLGGFALIDAGRRNGMLALKDAVGELTALAGEHGIAAIGLRETSGSTGAIGYFARALAEAGVIAIVLCGTPKAVAAAGGVDPVFGTNPIAVGLPVPGDAPIVLDMATGAIAWFGLIAARDRGETIGEGLAYDADGRPTTDPQAALGGAIRAFAGAKGSGLALAVEALTGVLVGGGLPGDDDANANRGNLLIALDPAVIAGDDYGPRMQTLVSRVRAGRPAESGGEILLPGERGDRLAAARVAEGSIELDAKLLDAIETRAQRKK